MCGLRKIQYLRPKHIKVKWKAPWVQGLCIKCENMDMRLQSLCRAKPGIDCLRSVFTLSTQSLCVPQPCPGGNKFNKKICAERQCPRCGVSKLEQDLVTQLSDSLSTNVEWLVCESAESPRKNNRQEEEKWVGLKSAG